jgi:hypothetical protein
MGWQRLRAGRGVKLNNDQSRFQQALLNPKDAAQHLILTSEGTQ